MDDILLAFPDKKTFDKYWAENYIPVTYEDVKEGFEQFVEETFHGSLPAFIAAFTSHKKLSPKEADEIQRMIDRFKEEG